MKTEKTGIKANPSVEKIEKEASMNKHTLIDGMSLNLPLVDRTPNMDNKPSSGGTLSPNTDSDSGGFTLSQQAVCIPCIWETTNHHH